MADPIGSIGAGSATTDYTSSTSNRLPVQSLGQKDFIQLLVAQLTTQDPLNPQKDTEFIGQMAQFSALENSKSLQTEMQTMRANQLLGQTVEVKIADDHTAKGIVTAVDSSGADPKIMIGTQAFGLGDILRIDQPTVAHNTSPS